MVLNKAKPYYSIMLLPWSVRLKFIIQAIDSLLFNTHFWCNILSLKKYRFDFLQWYWAIWMLLKWLLFSNDWDILSGILLGWLSWLYWYLIYYLSELLLYISIVRGYCAHVQQWYGLGRGYSHAFGHQQSLYQGLTIISVSPLTLNILQNSSNFSLLYLGKTQ